MFVFIFIKANIKIRSKKEEITYKDALTQKSPMQCNILKIPQIAKLGCIKNNNKNKYLSINSTFNI